jgi:hypothetical protein
MPRLEYFLVAESCSVDESSRSVSIFNVLNEVDLPHFPFVLPNIALVACWICDPNEVEEQTEHAARFAFKIPGSTENKDFTGSFKTTTRVHHLIYRLQFIPVPAAGEMTIELHLDGQRQASHTVIIREGEAD